MAYQMTEEHKAKLLAARQAKKDEKQANGGIITHATPIVRSAADPTSLRKAVDAKCYVCIYDKAGSGSWRDQVKACLVGDKCPIFKCRIQ